jgi:hypothetical protein
VSQRTIAAALLMLLPLLAYIPALNGNYLWDDDHHVTQNKNLRDLPGLARIWTRLGLANGGTPQYYPLTHTTFWIQYQLHGTPPFQYHLVNVLLHGISAVLAWQILLRLNVPAAWLPAAVWAIHPVNVETVAWITERKNVLSGTLCLASIFFYLKDGRKNYSLALGLFVLALLSKTTVSVMPVILFLILWWKNQLSIRRIAALIPFVIVGVCLGFLTATVERRYVGAVGLDWDFSFAQRLLIAGRAAWFYVGKFLWPARLSFSYYRWKVDASSGQQWLYPLAVAGMIVATFRMAAVRAGVLSFLILLFPAMGFFNIYPMRYSFVADHFQYLASLPMIALIVSGMSCCLTIRGRQLAGAALLIALFVTTWNRASDFHDSITLWRDTIAKNPSSWMARNNLAMALTQQAEETGSPAELPEATELLRQTLDLRPQHEWAHFGLGKIAQLHGDLNAAKSEFQQEATIEPDYPPTYFELGMIAMNEGDSSSAQGLFEKSRELDSKPPHGRNVPVKLSQTRMMLARLYSTEGRAEDAQRMLDEARQIKTLQ